MKLDIAIHEFKLKLTCGNPQIGTKWLNFRAVWPPNLTDDLKTNKNKSKGTSSVSLQTLCNISSAWVNSNKSYNPKTLNSIQNCQRFCPVSPYNMTDDLQQGKSERFDSCDWPSNLKLDSNRKFFCQCDREIWWMTSKKNRALFLYYVKLCASFQIYWWIQTEFTVQKRSIRVEIGDMLFRVTLKFDGWPWKTIGHLFYATSSFVQHFLPIGEFKLELQSGNAQSGSNSTIFRAVRPWNLTNDLEKQ